jgi:N-acetylglutamate synthase-like GNAT family acetyltransferase
MILEKLDEELNNLPPNEKHSIGISLLVDSISKAKPEMVNSVYEDAITAIKNYLIERGFLKIDIPESIKVYSTTPSDTDSN